MTALVTCRCGYTTEATVRSATAAEVLADRHETSGAAVRRPYAHTTTVRVYDDVREVVL